MRVKYVTCEIFMNEMVNSLNKKTQSEFREKYRNIDRWSTLTARAYRQTR
ncbi:MAG: hypothetical protein IJ984_03360, partial [Prevotella sp.]|nr:hypothetical protein [Prevotella sp.]